MKRDLMNAYEAASQRYIGGSPLAEKVKMGEADVLRSIYSFFDKKHTRRIAHFIEGLDKESREALPDWMIGNLIDLMNTEEDYLKKHFNPSEFKRRLSLINKDLTWLNTININGGHAALDVLLHTVMHEGIPLKIIERIYPEKRHIWQLEDLEELISRNALDLKKPTCFGIESEGDFCFCFDQYIENGRHPEVDEFKKKWYGEAYVHLWNQPTSSEGGTNNNILEIDKNAIQQIYLDNSDAPHQARQNLEKIFLTSEKSTEFIHHNDFNRLNVLVTPDGDFRIIDWSGWCRAKIGMGYALARMKYTSENLTGDEIQKIVFDFFTRISSTSLEEFSANFVLYNANHYLDKDLSCIKILIDYHIKQFME